MKLLLVEDAKHLQRAVAAGLRKAGYAVDATGDGEEGLWLAESNDYDAIILDIMLPGLDGLTLLERLRRQGKGTHVLLLTAKDTVDDRVRGLRMGADDYLIKPFAFEELLARVQALCRRAYGHKQSRLVVGHLEIDLANKTVQLAGQTIKLKPREYALLEYLALRQKEVVSRPEIEAHIYGDETDRLSNGVDYTPAGGSILVRYDEQPGRFKLTVANTVKDLKPADLPNLFQRFHAFPMKAFHHRAHNKIFVAQSCTLPYRRFAIGRASERSNASDVLDGLQDAILRYSATRRNRNQSFWTAAGSEAPRRFGIRSKSGVATSLCHRSPKSSRLATISSDTDRLKICAPKARRCFSHAQTAHVSCSSPLLLAHVHRRHVQFARFQVESVRHDSRPL